MGKAKYGSKEYSREQKLVHENQQLKKDVAQLRKRLARIELDRFERLEKDITEHFQEDNPEQGQKILQKVKDEWLCHSCKIGHLKLVVYNKPSGVFYLRKCDSCENRTKSQPYLPGIK